ncbi:MAG TPA: hypothetical protein VG407_12025 [Caulobacteraceae bacterium]|nr:hypothetical protein [Caulobacteraceae bacterium]
MTLKALGAATTDAPRLHLRFDRVVVELTGRLKAALEDVVPDGRSLIVTCTAPIRQSGKTAVETVEIARALIARSHGAAETGAEVQGNAVRLRLVKTGASGAAKIIAFVHNCETPAELVLDMTQALIEALDEGAARRSRRLVVDNPNGPRHARSWREVYAAIDPAVAWSEPTMVNGTDKPHALTDRPGTG